MPTKFVDLSGKVAKTVTVYTLHDIASRVAGDGLSAWTIKPLFEEWIENPEITTPAADYNIDDVDYWNPERVAEWKVLYDTEIEREEDRKAERLANQMLSKAEIITELLAQAASVANRNAGCYTYNRSNSMADGRRRVVELEGKINFVNLLLGDAAMTKEQSETLKGRVREAKSSVKMQ